MVMKREKNPVILGAGGAVMIKGKRDKKRIETLKESGQKEILIIAHEKLSAKRQKEIQGIACFSSIPKCECGQSKFEAVEIIKLTRNKNILILECASCEKEISLKLKGQFDA